MPRKAAGLTARQVATMKTSGFHAAGGVPGLYLQIAPGEGRSWVYRFQIAGKRRDMGLGPADAIGLAEARVRAAAARRMVIEGRDPIDIRRADRAAVAIDAARTMTFAECAEAYLEAHKAGWSASHAGQWGSTLEMYAHPVFGSLPVQAVDVGLVLKVVEPLWTGKTETANRVRGRIEAVLDWATARGHRQGENPARWRGHIENLLPRPSKVRRIEHLAALPYPEIGGFIVELRKLGGISARALEFSILTAARNSEVAQARWSEINVADQLWTVPAERMKARKEHRVPLSDAALAIVNAMAEIRQGDFVFPGRKPGHYLSTMALIMTLRRMGRGDLTVHGFRSTFRDWAAERTSFPTEIPEMALAHSVGGAVERAYRRSDLFEKRRQLAEAWARFCTAPPSTGRVVPIRAGAAIE